MMVQKMMAVALLLLIISGCKTAYQLSSTEKFRGMWKLYRFETLDSLSGKWSADTTRTGYSGYILYDGFGHMGVEQNPPGYKEFDVSKNIDSMDNRELKKIARLYWSNYVYFGNYTIENKTIDHKKLSATNPAEWGTSLKRDFEFKGDTLILITQEKINGHKLRIFWLKFAGP